MSLEFNTLLSEQSVNLLKIFIMEGPIIEETGGKLQGTIPLWYSAHRN